MLDYDNHTQVLDRLAEDQNADKDRREMVREVEAFLDKPDGQWDPRSREVFDQFNRPRYTFDRCNPVVEAIWGEMAQNDFDIKVRPAGGDATKELAKTMDGIVRNIESMSDAAQIYKHNGKKIIRSGFGAAMVKQRWADNESFEQDLFIENIPNAVDRVFFDASFEKQTAEDANHVNVLQTISMDEYGRRFGKERSPQSVGQDRSFDLYHFKAEGVTVGSIWYKKPVTLKLWQIPVDMPQFGLKAGAVIGQDQEKIIDEIEAALGKPLKTRTRKTFKIKTRLYDGGRWLKEEESSVFDFLPVVPFFAHFTIAENKVLYHGAIEKLIDQQRVINFIGSKDVEDIAFSPRPKYWMTDKQVAGNEDTLQTLNTNSDPVQQYTADAEAPPPQYLGGTAVNPASAMVMATMEQGIEKSAGVFGINPQNNKGLQSGVALERLENRGQTGTYEYFEGQSIAICQIAKILVHAIPKVYNTERQMRILNEDGSFEMISLNGQRIVDEQTQEAVEPIDLSLGTYDVTCDIGPAFKNRQAETARVLLELGAVVPNIIEQNQDVLLSNISAPGMDIAAERARASLVTAGMIPQDQLNKEEIEQLAKQSQQPKEPSPDMILAQAEDKKGQAQIMEAENDLARLRIDAIKVKLKSEAQDFEQQEGGISLILAQQKQAAEISKTEAEALSVMAKTINELKDVLGAQAVIGPHTVEAVKQQAVLTTEFQEELAENLP